MMTPLFSGFALIAAALAVALSGFIKMITVMQLRQRVDAGYVGARELAELSGITDGRDLQDMFGPPGMDRIWHNVSLAQINAKRRLAGYLMSDNRLHWACIVVAVMVLIFSRQVWLQIPLMIAILIQAGAWLSATQLPK